MIEEEEKWNWDKTSLETCDVLKNEVEGQEENGQITLDLPTLTNMTNLVQGRKRRELVWMGTM